MDLREELTAYLDNELSPDDRARVDEALAQDPALQRDLDRLRSAILTVTSVPLEPPAPHLRVALMARLAPEKPKVAPFGKWLAGLLMAGGAALLFFWANASAPPPEAGLAVAGDIELLQDYDAIGLESPEDLDVVAALDDLERAP